VLLLDEPTKGLDSFTAHYMVSALAKLARNRNKVILMSIHQPRSDIFNLFDQIGILSLGRVVYYGPQKELVPHFSKLGFPCPTYSNPLDHYGKLLH
jgi:ATP-binding cassette subfamily G (WHITE) protein 5 (sterolin 1)